LPEDTSDKLKFLAVVLSNGDQKSCIGGVRFVDQDRGYDIRFDAAHQVDFDPLMLLALPIVFVVKPTNETAGAESRSAPRLEGEAA